MYHDIGDIVKKVIGLGLLSVLLITGCTNKVTCTMKSSETGRKVDTTINIKFNNDKVKIVNEKIVFKFDKDYVNTIDTSYDEIRESFKQYESEKGIDIDASKGKDSIIVNIKIDPEKQKDSSKNLIDIEQSKEDLISDLTNEGYTCK